MRALKPFQEESEKTMFIILAGHLAGTPGVSTVLIENFGPMPTGFTATALLGTAPTFFEAFDLATDRELTAA